ncbi:MAG: hypothetical protein IJC57_00110 [Clostridia bacterium]|nr:hypothetical protein [Clostridia bacterium]
MRTKNSIRNILVSFLSYFIILIGSFITRKIFVNVLGLKIIGIEGMFLNVVSALSIIELGLGTGIVYKLYKPIANSDWEQVSIILCFLRKAYYIISASILIIGIGISYFVISPISDDFSKIWLAKIFILYILDIIFSYLYAHKRSMFIADQKNYVNNLIHILVQIIMFTSQIFILKFSGSFELYLIIKILCRIFENTIISLRFDKRYTLIDLKIKKNMPELEKKDLFRNIRAMLVHKISAYGATSASSLIIAYGVNLRTNGIYYNYMLIVNAITTVTSEFFNSITASFGNLLNSSENKVKIYENFNVLYFLNFLIYSFGTSAFVCIITPFMNIWTGPETGFNIFITISIAGYLYIYGIRQSIGMVKTGAGIYDPDKYTSLMGAFVSILTSFVLVDTLGIAGVMIGNVVGILSASYWTQPYLVYRNIFKKEVKYYHYRFVLYTVLTSLYIYLCYIVIRLNYIKNIQVNFSDFLNSFNLSGESSYLISQIFVNFIVCLIIPNILNLIIFCKSKELSKILDIFKNILIKK